MSNSHVIYIRGLGDSNARGQKLAIALWRLYGVRPHFFDHKWSEETYEKKQERLLGLIDYFFEKTGQPVGLIGVSAGASLALNVFAARKDKIKGVACISGKVLHPETLGRATLEHNPAFLQSMQELKKILPTFSAEDKTKIRSVYSSGDHTVKPLDSIIEGANNELVGVKDHGPTIAQQITLGAKKNIDFLKQL